MTTSAAVDLIDEHGNRQGRLMIDTLPAAETWRDQPTLQQRAPSENAGSGADLRLLEELTYRYRIDLDGPATVNELEPREAFSPDPDSLASGRLQPGRMTGTVRVSVTTTAGDRSTCEFEVRSRKLNYETEYRRMMQRLAEEGAELVQSSFAGGSFGGFDPDQAVDARTLYQRFAFLESLLDSEPFAEAVEIIRYRPHTEHRIEYEEVDPARQLKPSRSLAQQLTGASDRQQIARPVAGLSTIPRTVTRQSHFETLDTVPNRFVKFALEHWKILAARVHDLLPETGVEADRGRREAQRIESRLEHLLTIPAMAEAGPLLRFPSANTVLNARAGYRQIFRSFLISDVAASLSWEGGDDVFSAGKRDVATLYEYWVFLELARVIETIPGFRFDRTELIAETKDGMNLNLRSGTEVVLRGEGRRRGRAVHLELWFNRSFTRGAGRDTSWTVTMRPDCSLRITPLDGAWDSDTWVHFDAKYRIHQYSTFFHSDAESEPEEAAGGTRSGAKNADLQKMHAYRDAIRRTSGAYVLYPGDDDSRQDALRQYHEVLPGLGAFVLRPSENGEATSVAAGHLASFLIDVIDHAAAQGTGRERARYWQDQSYANSDDQEHRQDFEPSLGEPPADSTVLLGFVRSDQHLDWINQQRIYNLRADPTRAGSVSLDSPGVRAQFVALYRADRDEVLVYRSTEALYIRTGDELRASGYPTDAGSSGSGNLYLCIGLGERVDFSLDGRTVRGLAPEDGSPFATTWDELSRHAAAN